MHKPTMILSVAVLAVLAFGCEDKKATKPTASRAKKQAEPAVATPPVTRPRPSLAATDEGAEDAPGEAKEAGNADAPGFPEKGRWRESDRAKFDKDGNGRLSREERDSMRQARVDDALKKLDQDGDGAISEAELSKSDERTARRVLRRFSRYDLDSDGKITSEELSKGMKRRRRPNIGWGGRRNRPREDR